MSLESYKWFMLCCGLVPITYSLQRHFTDTEAIVRLAVLVAQTGSFSCSAIGQWDKLIPANKSECKECLSRYLYVNGLMQGDITLWILFN